MSKRKVLIVGASGFVGSYIYNYLSKNNTIEVTGTQFKGALDNLISLNYNNVEFFNFLQNNTPDILIWLAGEKNLSKTEGNFKYAVDSISRPISEVSKIKSITSKTRMIYLSTDYVFDGVKGNYTINDITDPKSFYGTEKLAAEKYIIDKFNKHNIIRAGSIMGNNSKFYSWIINELNTNKKIELFDNYFSPTPIINILNLIEDLIFNGFDEKLIHVNGNMRISRYGIGNLIKKMSNSKTRIIKKDYKESKIKLFKDLSLTSTYNSHKNISVLDQLEKMIK